MKNNIKIVIICAFCFVFFSGFTTTNNFRVSGGKKEEVNPIYEVYEKLPEDVKQKVNIPIRKYIYKNEEKVFSLNDKILNKGTIAFPPTYNLKNVNGNNYAPAIRNQANAGLCWAFAMNSTLESYLIRAGVENARNLNFSENASDLQAYLLSSIGLIDSEYNTNDGNYDEDAIYNWELFGPVTEETFGMSYTDNPLNYVDNDLDTYADYSNFEYDVTTKLIASFLLQDMVTSNLILNDTIRNAVAENFSNRLKYYLMNYGALSVSVLLDDSFKSDNNLFVYNNFDNNDDAIDEFLNTHEGHAVTLIGWDDNYGDIDNDEVNDGAWIVQNSWGDFKSEFYVSYYDIMFMLSGAIGINDVSNIKYDNFYDVPYNSYVYNNDDEPTSADISFNYKTGVNRYHSEIVKNVKVLTNLSGVRNVSVTIEDEYGTEICRSTNSSEMGFSTENFTFNNCVVDDEFYIVVIVPNYNVNDDVYAVLYTNNDETTEEGDLISVYFDNDSVGSNNYWIIDKTGSLLFYSLSTNGLISGDFVDVSVFADNNIDITNNFEIRITDVLNNYVVASLRMKNSVKYNNISICFENGDYSNCNELTAIDINGVGTENDPYLIQYPEDLIIMHDSLNANTVYYKLVNDLDLKYIDFQGNGFQMFDGNLDGNGHSLKNIRNTSGLFDNLYESTIHDLKIVDSHFSSSFDDYVGAVASSMTDSRVYNVEINNCTIEGETVGGIAGIIYDSCNISNTKIVDSDIYGYSLSGGIFGDYINLLSDDLFVNTNSNFIENTKIYMNTDSNYVKSFNEFKPGYIFGTMSLFPDSGDEIDITINMQNNKYLRSNSDLEDIINAGGTHGNILEYSYGDNNVTVTDIESDLGSLFVNLNNNEITNEESILQVTYANYDFTNIWGIKENETARLIKFDIPSELEDVYINPKTGINTQTISGVIYAKGFLPLLVDETNPRPNDLNYFLSKFDYNTNSTLIAYNPNGSRIRLTNPILGTGSVLEVTNGYDIESIVIIVKGDINGDSKVRLSDIYSLAEYILDPNVLEQQYQLLAGDVSGDGNIRLSDIMQLSNYLLGGEF